MDYLGIEKFMGLGFCIGGPFIWNLLRRAPNRVVAGVLAPPSESRPEMRDLFYDTNMRGWSGADKTPARDHDGDSRKDTKEITALEQAFDEAAVHLY
jgi:dienelactone hydrolase